METYKTQSKNYKLEKRKPKLLSEKDVANSLS